MQKSILGGIYMKQNSEKSRELKDYWKQSADSKNIRQEFQKNMKAIQSIEVEKETVLQQLRTEISKSNESTENYSANPSSIMDKIRTILNNSTREVKDINDEEIKELAVILIDLLNLLNNPSYSYAKRTIASSVDDLMKLYTKIPEEILAARDEVCKRIISYEIQAMRKDMTKIEAINNLTKPVDYNTGIPAISKSKDPYIYEKKVMVRTWLYDLLQLAVYADNHIYIEVSLSFIEDLIERLGWNDTDIISQVESLEKITALLREGYFQNLRSDIDTISLNHSYKQV